MAETPVTPTRMTWLVIVIPMALAPAIYVAVASMIAAEGAPARSPVHDTLRLVFVPLAVVMLLASRLWLARRAGDREDARTAGRVPLPPAEYQLQSTVAAALAESCAVYGFVLFFLGGSIRQLAAFAAGSVIALAGFVIPHGLAYWSRREEFERTQPR